MIVGSALWASFSAIAPPRPRDRTTTASIIALTRGSTASEQLSHRMRHLGSRIARPIVQSITRDTERLLGEVSPLIPRASPREAKRARDLSKQIVRTDSAAFALLDKGYPIRALQTAFDARGLIPAVRQNVAEERAFR
jgi:hypothetical protein